MQNITLSELVKRHPLATTFLNEHHIDYCCGGDDLLYHAIEKAGYNQSSILSDLDEFLKEQEAKFNPSISGKLYQMSVSELISHLEATHHRDERMLLTDIDAKLATILSVHYTSHKEELVTVFKLFADLRKELLVHFVQEEEEVFPLMREEATAVSLAMVEALEADHEAAGVLIKALVKATHDFTAPKDSCPTYEATYALLKRLVEDVFLHIYKENSILFPLYEKGVA
jgi:regulator of cell morphogenesis and NO signaling